LQSIRLACFGDVVGKSGRAALRRRLNDIRRELDLSFVLVNGENSAGGLGIDPDSANEIFNAGANVITLGDHAFNRREVLGIFDRDRRVIRPFNYPPETPGFGWFKYALSPTLNIGVFTVLGTVFMGEGKVSCPFRAAKEVLSGPLLDCEILLAEIHAEATSEKSAFGWYLDGLVTLVFGTHTHVLTADERILPKGTGFITDIGMCGPSESVIGMDIDTALHRFTSPLPRSHKVGRGDAIINGLVIEYDLSANKLLSLSRITESVKV
jgi:metallophosphoesterase (TIGR00282 family)